MEGTFKTLRTVEGTVMHLFCQPGKNPVPHSIDGPAIKYPKSAKRSDEYFIYGVKYSKDKWLEAKNDVKVTYMPLDPNLG